MESKTETKPVEEKKDEASHDVDYADPEKDKEIKASGLADVVVVKGTEGEVCIWKNKVKLFRFRD